MRKNARAFTLFEMVVVIAIFVLLAGGIYATVNAAVRATATLSEENLQIQRLNAFVSLLRRTFHNLPGNAVFSGNVRSQDGAEFAEIVLRDAQGVFAWGLGGASTETAILSARPRLGGGRELSILILPGSLGEMERREALRDSKWLRLLPDLREVQWRFYDETQRRWVGEWMVVERPSLVELTILLLGEDTPRKFVFWLPPVQEPSAPEVSPEESNLPPGPPEENEEATP